MENILMACLQQTSFFVKDTTPTILLLGSAICECASNPPPHTYIVLSMEPRDEEFRGGSSHGNSFHVTSRDFRVLL